MASVTANRKKTNRVRKPPPLAGLADAPASGDPVAGSLIVLGPEVDIAGSVYIDARVRLEGTIDGEIRCTELDVTKTGHVRGRIVAERVTVYGTVVDGSIYANTLILRPGCSVEAEIYHEHLQLEPDSYFDGKSRRVTDPTAMAPA